MIEWLLYNTVLPLLPVPLVYLGSWMIGTRQSVLAIIRDGQLCFYCTALSAVTIRDLAKTAGPGQPIAMPLAGILFCMILSTFAYGVAVTTSGASSNPTGQAGFRDDWKLGLISIGAAVTTTVIVAITRQTMGLI